MQQGPPTGVVDRARSVVGADGLAALTGRPDGPPLPPAPDVVQRLDHLARQLAAWSSAACRGISVRWEPFLLGRAASLGLHRNARVSANGSCRLLRASDAWVACNLAREDDLSLVDALVGSPADDHWAAIARTVAGTPADDFVARARLLGLPASRLDTPWVLRRAREGTATGGPWQVTQLWDRLRRAPEDVTVVDLSSMWAGPLAARLLADSGATVVKVESVTRPDGARATPAFYRTLHAGDQPEVALDFGTDAGRLQLRSLIEAADVVIEASRPRALEQLGCAPHQVSPRPGRIWLSITGYGRSAPGGDWVAFGDDAAVAGGLVGWEAPELPVFFGDAVADPVTGLTAALAAFRALAGGGGVLLDVPMAVCAAAVAGRGIAGSER